MTRLTDVVIVGGGLTGAATAHGLAQRGIRSVLVDLYAEHPVVFKAEKAGPHSAPLFDKLGLSDAVQTVSSHIEANLDARNGQIVRKLVLGERGYYYHDLVNEVRRRLPPSVEQVVGRVQSIEQTGELQTVCLQGGEEIAARLVVVAAGAAGKMHEILGIEKRPYIGEEAVGFAFLIERGDGQPFFFEGSGLTYYPDGCESRMSYFSMFPVPYRPDVKRPSVGPAEAPGAGSPDGAARAASSDSPRSVPPPPMSHPIPGASKNAMRVNFFGFRSGKDPWVHEMQRRPEDVVRRTFPKLSSLVGDIRVVTKVETAVLQPYVAVDVHRPGVVLIGDARMTVPPSTGKGVYKLLNDVLSLVEHAPEWLKTPGMGPEKIRTHYDDPTRAAAERFAREKALYQHWCATSLSIRAAVHREKHFLMERAKNLVGYTADVV